MIVSSRIKPVILMLLKKYRKAIFFFILAALILPEITLYFHEPSTRGKDLHGYIDAGRDALRLGELYKFSLTNTWPPFFSFFSVPLALCNDLLGLSLTKMLWYLLNFTAFVISMKIMVFMLYKKRAGFFSGDGFDFTSDLIAVPFFLVLPAFIANFYWLQINMLILLLLISGLYFYDSQKDWKAGFFFGLVASIKAYPGLFLIYFLFRRQWKTATATLLWSVAFTVSPILFYGFQKFTALMNEWISMSLLNPLEPGLGTYNQSLYAFWERLLVNQLRIVETAPSHLISIANYCSIALIAIIVFSSILNFPHKRASISAMIEYSIICVMMILFPPVAWRHYWVLLLPATVSIYYCMRMTPGIITPLVRYLLSMYVFFLGIPYLFSKTPIGELFKYYSCYTIAALVILAVLIILHRNCNLQQSDS